jgi:hypothetical protein
MVNPSSAMRNDSLAFAIHLLSPTARERGSEPTITMRQQPHSMFLANRRVLSRPERRSSKPPTFVSSLGPSATA